MRHEFTRGWVFALPYCYSCGLPLEQGLTATGRRAWFCAHPSCAWYDQAVAAVYIGRNDTLAGYRDQLWEQRMRQSRDAYWPVPRNN